MFPEYESKIIYPSLSPGAYFLSLLFIRRKPRLCAAKRRFTSLVVVINKFHRLPFLKIIFLVTMFGKK